MNIYLDNNATTIIDARVKAAMEPFLSELFANPSSPYESGNHVRRHVEDARNRIAEILGARSGREIVFTSGGTESNNSAIRSALQLFPEKKKIVISQVEHSSVKNLCDQLAKVGYQIISIGVLESGSLNWGQFLEALSPDVAIVSMMWANNETGVLFPVHEIAKILSEKKILFHVDAVQAVGKIPVRLKETTIDYVSFSAHKIHGPKGIGGLYIRETSPFQPFMLGGRQEHDRRAGTENTAGIAGLWAALELTVETDSNPIAQLRDELETGLTQKISGSFVNGGSEPRIPNTTNITIPGIEAETFLIRLSQLGIEASSGSACLTGALEPSHVLMAMGRSREFASSSIRLSLSRFTTAEQIHSVLETIPKLVTELRPLSQSPAGVR